MKRLLSLTLVLIILISCVGCGKNEPVNTDTPSTTESTTVESTTETTTETTIEETTTETTTEKKIETTTKKKTETITNKQETTTKKTQSTNKSNSRSARTKAEMLALTNLTVSDLKYYDSIGLGEYVEWAFFPNVPDDLREESAFPPGFVFTSFDKKVGWVKENYYLYHGKLCYIDTTNEYEEIKSKNTWTDEDFQQNVEDAKNYKCPYCNDHNCCSLEYIAMTNGVVYNVGSTDKICPEVAAERARCDLCGKIIVDVEDNRWYTQPDKYCDDMCEWGFSHAGEAG